MSSTEKNVVGIKFGVFGKGAITGDSGARILRQLTEIVEHINKEPPRFKIKLGVDQNFFKKQIASLAKQINAQVHNIKVSSNIGGEVKQTNKTSPNLSGETSSIPYFEILNLMKKKHAEEAKLLTLRNKGADVLEKQKAILADASDRLQEAREKLDSTLNEIQTRKLDEHNQRLQDQLELKRSIAKQQDHQSILNVFHRRVS